MKRLIINLVAFIIIGMGSMSLMQNDAKANNSSAAALMAKCKDDDGNETACGAQCGTAEVLGVEVCVCNGKCPE